ncbi:hypothetical protein [Anaerobiospirillum sp. NML120511]|uniref:hypothetical protein n=1 Tax=Anaerobiospirillum sp. NML120511 TaxID=2932819 RepID=UPI001FF3008E|nr:hypothetical protein [Anaerobiospirillum sp. NML120511]MCK0535919.1 hypothetical protein [Anaerobiospirillum sp. NML120511]
MDVFDEPAVLPEYQWFMNCLLAGRITVRLVSDWAGAGLCSRTLTGQLMAFAGNLMNAMVMASEAA